MDFTQPGRYDEIYNHIQVHKYYLNQNKKEELLFEEAIVSWYNNVYRPIVQIIEEDMIRLNFPGRSAGDLYVWIVQHWDYLKKENGVNFPVTEAVRDYSLKYGKNRGRVFRFLAAFFAKLFRLKRHSEIPKSDLEIE